MAISQLIPSHVSTHHALDSTKNMAIRFEAHCMPYLYTTPHCTKNMAHATQILEDHDMAIALQLMFSVQRSKS